MFKKRNIITITIVLVTLFFTTACSGNSKYDYLVLVNKYTKLPDDWEKKVELVTTKNAWDEDI